MREALPLPESVQDEFRRFRELCTYILLTIGFSKTPLTPRQSVGALPHEATLTLQNYLSNNSHYGSRSAEMIADLIDAHLCTYGFVSSTDFGRKFTITERGEEYMERLLEKGDSEPQFLVDIPELVAKLAG